MWDWHAECFLAQPARIRISRPLTLYRVWGGAASEMGSPTRPGVCLSLHIPRSRRDAERLFAVWEWGNNCRHVSTFQVAPGATIFVGTADPGDFYDSGLGAPGSQVFVETAEMHAYVRKAGFTKLLVDDMDGYAVIPNKDPGKARSS